MGDLMAANLYGFSSRSVSRPDNGSADVQETGQSKAPQQDS